MFQAMAGKEGLDRMPQNASRDQPFLLLIYKLACVVLAF